MTWGDGASSGGRLPEPGDDTREGFARLVGRLFQQTGLSTNAFETAHGFGDAMVSKVQTGRQVPSFQFVEALIGEARDRAGLTEAAAEQILAAYGRMLRGAAADPAAKATSTMHKLMLQLFEDKMSIRALSAQLSQMAFDLAGTQEQLSRLKEERAAGRLVDAEEEERLLAHHRQIQDQQHGMQERRAMLLADVDRLQAQLAGTEPYTRGSWPVYPSAPPGAYTPLPPPSLPGSGAHPPHPSTGWLAGNRFLLVLAAVVVTVISLGSVTIITLAGRPQHQHNAAPPASGSSAPSTSPIPTRTSSAVPTLTPSAAPTPPPTTARPNSELLTDLDQPATDADVYGGRYFVNGEGTVNTTHYPYGHALISYGNNSLNCDGYSEFNLGKQWSKLSMMIGIDNTSEFHSAKVTVILDDKTIFDEIVSLNRPWHPSFNVTGGLRLRISFDDALTDDMKCHTGNVVLGNPTLSR